MAPTDTTIPPITGIDDPTQARVLLYQAGRSVHAPLDQVGLAVATDYLPLSGGTLTGTLTTNGRIVFPVTANPSADPNTLDDYEEGVWTPTISAGTGTITTASGSGIYTKIGRLVTYSAALTITTNGTGASGVRFTLPFTPSTTGLTLYGREIAIGGKSLNGQFVSGTTLTVQNYDNTYPGVSGAILVLAGHFVT